MVSKAGRARRGIVTRTPQARPGQRGPSMHTFRIRSVPYRLLGTSLLALSALACQDLLGLTPGKPDPTGGGGSGGLTTGGGGAGAGTTTTTTRFGTTTSEATGGTAGDGGGGSGGGAAGNGGAGGGCPAECAPSGPCENAECVDGRCVASPKPAGALVDLLPKGDCKASVCDGAGGVVIGPWFDPDDGNECTWDACAAGVAGHLPALDGTPCNLGGGVCAAGQCQVSACAPPNMEKDGTETGVDCGGACGPCATPGAECKVSADCGAALFCSSGVCTPRVLLAMIVKTNTIQLTAFRPGATPPWPEPVTETVNNVAGAGVAFDAAGEGVGVTRAGGSGARFARWKAEAWSASAPLSLSSAAWLPAFARTDAALFVFAQSSNLKHHFTAAAGPAGDPFLDVPSASSPLSGGAGARQGHASFFYAPIDQAGDLVEARFLGGAWTKAAVVLSGNHADCQPVIAPTVTGDLLVAAVRKGDEHELVWRVIAADAPKKQGTIPETLFAPEQPVPKRVALAPLPTGGAILAFRNPAGMLDVRVATDDGEGGFSWTPESVFPTAPIIAGEPALAKGLPGARAELVWIASGGNIVRHARWLDDGTWTAPVEVLSSGAASVAIATP